jgi:hypothetical protein
MKTFEIWWKWPSVTSVISPSNDKMKAHIRKEGQQLALVVEAATLADAETFRDWYCLDKGKDPGDKIKIVKYQD